MTSKCPDKDCGDNVTRVVFFMKIFGVALLAFIGFFVTFITYGLDADARDKAKVQIIQTNQAVVMDNIEKAVRTQGELKKAQQQIMLNVQKIQDDMEHNAERKRKVDEIILQKLNDIQRAQ